MANVVEYWAEPYVQKYMGDPYGDIFSSPVDCATLYDGLDSLLIKTASDATGVDGMEWMDEIEVPDMRSPFGVIVSNYIDAINKAAIRVRDDNPFWRPNSVRGLGPSRSFYFLSSEVIRGARQDGFHRNESALVGKSCSVDGIKYLEYPGFICSNRKFRFFQAPTMPVPFWDGIGPRHVQVGVHGLPEEARLHAPRAIWPAFRTHEERDDARTGRARENVCIMCKAYEVLYNTGVARNRKKLELRASGIRFPNTYVENKNKPSYKTNQATQTDSAKSAHLGTTCHSTSTPKLERKRSLSLGSSPTGGDAKKSLFHHSLSSIRNDSNVERVHVDESHAGTAQPSRSEKSNGAAVDDKKSPNPKGNIQSRSTADKPKGADKPKVADKPKSKKYSDLLISVCAEFARQEEEAIADHLANKAAGRYHLCPKLNFESTSSSEREINLTDRSCNSTCVCQKDRDTFNSTKSSGKTSEPVSTVDESSFLDVDMSENPNESGQTTSKDLSNNRGDEKTENGKKFPDKFQPNYFTQARPIADELSPQERLFRNLKEVNESGADIDESLVPDGSALTYDPSAKYPVGVLVDDVDEPPPRNPDGAEREADEVGSPPRKVPKSSSHNPMTPTRFYPKLKPYSR